MAWYNEKSQFNWGKYKGKIVKEVSDSEYIQKLHESKMNVYFTDEVLNRLNIPITKKQKGGNK